MAKSKQRPSRARAGVETVPPRARGGAAGTEPGPVRVTPLKRHPEAATGETATGQLTILSNVSEDLFGEGAEAFWLEAGREAVRDGGRRIEEATRQLMTIVSWAQSGYFALLSFGDVKKALAHLAEARKWAAVLVLISPMLCWVLSMIFAVRVFKTRFVQVDLSDSGDCKKYFVEGTVKKMKALRVAHVTLILGFALLICNVIIYMMFI